MRFFGHEQNARANDEQRADDIEQRRADAAGLRKRRACVVGDFEVHAGKFHRAVIQGDPRRIASHKVIRCGRVEGELDGLGKQVIAVGCLCFIEVVRMLAKTGEDFTAQLDNIGDVGSSGNLLGSGNIIRSI